MRYMRNTSDYADFNVFQRNRLKPRAYGIPYSNRDRVDAVTLMERRFCSDKVEVLNGDWDFAFYARPADLATSFSTEDIPFETLDVPSCWQFRGYDRPFYVNTRYQFPYHPPRIPKDEAVGCVFSWSGADLGIRPRFQHPQNEYNFLGVYRKKIWVEEIQDAEILSFLGVASCIEVYLNGTYVGYSEGSHNVAEFRLNDYLQTGENELLCIVHRWCNGTYLEAQDMFRNNGIFRDVLWYHLKDSDVYDYRIQTQKSEKGYALTVDITTVADAYGGRNDGRITFSIPELDLAIALEENQRQIVCTNLQVEEWNAEYPRLYDLYMETEEGCLKTAVGFRTIEIIEDRFLVNGRAIKLHGVNHHDTHPRNGYTMSAEDLLLDVKLCKDYNIDTMRMSHYPPDPLLLELCDTYGIYVVDEADVETHGTFFHVFPPSYNRITDKKQWASHYLERVERMYERDKNHSCIIMWSLGNESGGNYCMDQSYEYLKNHSNLPVHYESVIHTNRVAYDVGSQMYPSVERVHSVGNKTCHIKKLLDRPYFLCEYAHAMGVGPGNIEDYWKEIYSYENLMGGCVWEFADHAVLDDEGNYTYGGDHGEWEHDCNFCVDGIFYPNREPSTGAFIVRHAYRPLRITYLDNGQVEIKNTTGFTPGKVYRLECEWSDGRKASRCYDVAPLSSKVVDISPEENSLDSKMQLQGDLYLTIHIIDTRIQKEVGCEQLLIRKQKQGIAMGATVPMPVQDFNLRDGRVAFTEELQSAEEYTLLYRAGTDNDVDIWMRGTMEPYYNETMELVCETKLNEHTVQVQTKYQNRKATYLVTDTYETHANGVLVTSHIHTVHGIGKLPRFGKSFVLPKEYAHVTYQGRVGESYCDMKEQFIIARCSTEVSKMTEPNIRPQESGNRCDTSYVTVSDGNKSYSFTAVPYDEYEKKNANTVYFDYFELGIKPYSDKKLTKMRHRKDEQVSGTYVTLSAFQCGIGTGSCGPAVHPRYTYPCKRDYEFRFFVQRASV
ncbi:MAG: hypothetical protein K6A05_07275 [Lachnospiraceae bacterium]|nr:hypothetical protein [Lachnospiraceae bacterium]